MQNMLRKKFYEVKPGFDALRYLVVYGFLTALSKRKENHNRMFLEIASNIDRHCLSEGQFEKGVITLLRELCTRKGRTELMIDVGANIGNHSIALADLFAQVHSIEPHPVLFHILQANILRNDAGNITAHQFGLASENTDAELAESMEHHELGRIRDRSVLPAEVFGLKNETFSKSHDVQLRSASEFVGQFGDKLDKAFIKIDVEGMEQEIVETLLPVLKERKPILGFEWFVSAQPDLKSIALNASGYDFYGIVPHDVGQSYLARAIRMLFKGRHYSLAKIDANSDLAPVYPLALLVPRDD